MKTDSHSTDRRPPSVLRGLALRAASLLIVLAVVLGIAEATLRLFPQLIGLAALMQFEPGLRAEIAARLELPTLDSAIRITPAERFDKGPEIRLPGPNSTRTMLADPNDLALGAIEKMRVDENGFCNEPSQLADGMAEILLVGDSFTFCTAVRASETAAYKLQQLSGRTAYNLGVPGIGPDEYLELSRRHAARLKPRIVVFNVYEGNDLRDVERARAFISRKQDQREDVQRRLSVSYAVEFVRANLSLLVKTMKRFAADHDFRYAAMVDGNVMQMNTANSDQDEADIAVRLGKGEVSLELFAIPFKNFVMWARENRITPVVIYTPSMYTAYESTVTFSDPQVGAAVRSLSRQQRAWFADSAAKLGFIFHDLTPAFQKEAGAGRLTHFPSIVHLTPLGHTIVAQQLAALTEKL